MADVAKKKHTSRPSPVPPAEPDGKKILLRLEDARMANALDTYARQLRRSRNMAIILALEEVLARAGLWPPAPPPPA